MKFYLLLKSIHLLAVVAFLGNIVTGLFWMKFARKTNDVKIMHHTAKGLIVSDRIFTIPGVLIITAAGIYSAIYGGLPLLRTGWIFWSIILFSLSGVFFAYKVAPLQGRMRRSLESEGSDNILTTGSFDKLLHQWEFWGFLAVITPLIAFMMMVLKWPALSPLVT